MEKKDYILMSISAAAIAISLLSLIITLIQKSKETKRSIKKTLADTLEGISKIAIESSKLRAQKDIIYESEPIIQLRRNYNSQRRVLVAHADFIISHYDKLATETDCNVLAAAYAVIGDQERAELFWKKCIEKSIFDPIRLMNLRGFASFLFLNEKQDLGREMFNEAQAIQLANNDEYRILKIDTYLMQCDLEKEFGDSQNIEGLLLKAMEILQTLKSKSANEEMHKRINGKILMNR